MKNMSKSFMLGTAAIAAVLSSQVLAQEPPATQSPPPAEAARPPAEGAAAAPPSAPASAAVGAGAHCVPARESIKIKHNGQYHRIHPSGDMFLYTDSDRAVLVDLKDRSNPKSIRTAMREETYPVESANGGWELMASPVDGGGRGSRGGMDYFSMKDLLGNPSGAKPAYTDGQFGQYYHSSAELPGSDAKTKKVRTVLYEGRLFRDYEMEVNADGRIGKVTKSDEKKLCENIFKRPVRPPSAVEENRRLMQVFNTKEREWYNKWDGNEIRTRMRNAPPEERAELERQRNADRTAMEEIRIQAEGALYGPEYVTARNAVRDLRTKFGEAEKAYRDSAPYKEAQEGLRKAEREEDKAYQAVQNDPSLKRILDSQTKLETEHRASNTNAARRREIEREYGESQRRYDEMFRKLRADSSAGKVAKQLRIEAEKALRETEKLPLYIAYRDLSTEIQGLENAMRIARDGRNVGNPVVSKDGTHFAGIVGNSIEIYRIKDDGDCDEVAKVPFRGSKVSFSYPKEGQPLRITFTAEGGGPRSFARGVYVYNTETKEASLISGDGERAVYYPGFTLDGRIMYKTEDGMAIVDPLQAMKQGCIAARGEKSGTRDASPGSVTK